MKKIKTSKVLTREIRNVFNESISIPDGLVTNSTIRDQFITLLRKSHIIPSNYLLLIWKMIDKQIIIPVNNKRKGLLGFLNKRLKKTCVPFSYSYDDGTMAFYSGTSNRIFIIVDNILKADKSSDGIARTVVHELQHMQGHNFPSEFFNLHKSLIINLYDNFFKVICGNKLKTDPVAITNFAKFLIYMFDDIFSSAGSVITQSDFDSYRDKVALIYRNGKNIPDYGMQIANAVTHGAESMIDGKFFDNASRNPKSIERVIYMAFGMAYKKIGMDPNKLHSFFGQECIVPTEIVAMIPAIKITPNLFAFLNRLI